MIVAYEDYPDGSHKLRHFLTTPAGDRLELHFTGEAPDVQSGGHAKAKGVLIGKHLVLEQSELEFQNGSKLININNEFLNNIYFTYSFTILEDFRGRKLITVDIYLYV